MKTMKSLELISALCEARKALQEDSPHLDIASIKDDIKSKVIARFSLDNICLQQEQGRTRKELIEELQRAVETGRKYGD
ncbi:MAG: hypothetical protein ACNYPH_01665 [Gammaproteobacteria bacterium WSBS_2016_MAG_OTU1]